MNDHETAGSRGLRMAPIPRDWRRLLVAIGPGLVVMLADTEAGSVIAASQSGAIWGYRMLVLQFLLVPVLFLAQDLALRLGVTTGKGMGALIQLRLGRGWARLAAAMLVVSCLGALLTQMSGLAGVGQLFGVPAWATIAVAVAGIFAMVCTGSYHAVERIALVLGAAELAFLVVAWRAHPDTSRIVSQLAQQPLRDSGYLYLVAANLGTCVMPWMIFYHQSAVIEKGLTLADLKLARFDTLLGAIVCQTVTAAVLVAAAATLGAQGRGDALHSVSQIAGAFGAVLGKTTGEVVFAVGLSGGALVATIVVCLAAARVLGEVTGFDHSLELHPFDAPWFYGSFGVILVAGGALVASGIDLVRLSIGAGVVNAVLLPLVLLFLWRLARKAPPPALRLRGAAAVAEGAVFVASAGLGLYAAVVGVLG
jgi:Mn2+/Fe2+ NRAMP family transporter